MKSTGIVRRIDRLGRIVLPKELREVFDWNEKDSVEIYTDGDGVYLKAYQPGCFLCNSMDGLETIKGTQICRECRAAIKAMG